MRFSTRKLASEDDLYTAAINGLARRAYSVFEMRTYLERRAEDKEAIKSILERLKELNYLDDARYARQFVRQHTELRKQGAFRIARDLRARGVPDRHIESSYDGVMKTDVPALDHQAFVAMIKQMFSEQTGSAPNEVVVGSKDVTIEDKEASKGMKVQLDTYALALGRSAWLMSLKCGCDANAVLESEAVGEALLKAKYSPSFKRPQVGLP